MKNLIRLAVSILFFNIVLSGCYYDKENELYPTTECGDTTNVTYTLSIKPLMAANCNTCHSPANPSGNVITSTYPGLKDAALSGNLWYAVNWEGPKITHMPQGAIDTLSVCARTKIKKWIDAGAPEN
jgi:hypothetical protein